MKQFSPPQMKEVSFPTPYTPHPTPCHQEELFAANPNYARGLLISQDNCRTGQDKMATPQTTRLK
ncbi:MAG: hypothetical protein GPI90_08595 [Microcystis aeruginosa K13-05]|uniref:hypothetical protein n=1 Tax=unclassified Microcystis TaxID=2643300 RepID=UPI00031E7754|nr:MULTISPECIES: hypothetical protein [unclassified Microcystis]MCE2661277.1 hypothetical protein [Microcystis sp. 53602_E8]MDJ0545544.1 hypothetical protein [Microcystis sp. M53601_WE4]MDJ0562796.1 hypothetical protein [Microcystis sp. M49629_WE12]NCR80072.1 hypothetical protein [Microcystis aeruginosa K13-10]NCR84707.1 hypothetical protein [Microcystis aeruginosa K13-05]